MANDGQIVFEVTADGKHAIADIKDITKQIENETKKWDNSVKESTNGMDASFSGLIKKLSVAAIGAGIVNGLKNIASAAIQAASDLEEVQNVVDVTFGSDAGRIDEWAKNAGTQFGLTETQAKKFSSTMGAMLKSSGMAGQEIVQVSTDLAGLAADMASFYNLDFDTAFQKIRSGISGETMPLKELGINMSVATLNAFALEKGLTKTFDQMSQGEQTMLRYQYLMQATSDAQGDFARTSDGYANSMRKLETNIESIKAKLGAPLLNAVSDAVGALNSFLEMLMPDESKRTVLDDFADIDFKTEAKLQEIAQIKAEAQATADILEEIYGSNENPEQGKDAADYISKYGVKAKETTEYLAGLGFTTDEINEKQGTWLETCKRLVKTIPGLNEIINTETGEVKGGRRAIDEYITAWEEGQKKLALLKAQADKKQALAEKHADLPGLEVDKMLWDDRLRKAKEQLQRYYKEMGVTAESMQKWWEGKDFGYIGYIQADELGLTEEQRNFLNEQAKYFDDVQRSSDKATKDYNTQKAAYEEGIRIIEEGEKVIEATYGAEQQAAEGAKEWSDEMKEAGKTAVMAAQEALTALEDHVKGVRDSIEKSIDSTIKGFEYIGNASQRQAKRLEPLEKELLQLDKKSKNYEKTLADINERTANAKDTFGIGNLKKNLQSQMEFLREYKQDMEKARALGFSDEFLAQFSDGSVESAEWLHELANASGDATKGDVKTLNDLYGEVQRGKRELTDTLTEQNLSVDEVYKNLADKAKEAVAALDMEGEAAENTGKTISGVARGIGEHVDEVADQVDAIIAELDRLNGYGINIDFGGFGSINFTTSTGKTEGSGRMGLDYIPHDDYIARLHEGERVLTAQENQIWNSLLNGGVHGFDLDSLGGVMRDNIKAGGNVYLDGKIVGNVISDRQGKSYKSMQRSGWQV